MDGYPLLRQGLMEAGSRESGILRSRNTTGKGKSREVQSMFWKSQTWSEPTICCVSGHSGKKGVETIGLGQTAEELLCLYQEFELILHSLENHWRFGSQQVA